MEATSRDAERIEQGKGTACTTKLNRVPHMLQADRDNNHGASHPISHHVRMVNDGHEEKATDKKQVHS